MPVKFHRAERRKAKLRLAIAGPAGSGKTYSALLIAFGLGGRVAMIDTERGSGELYAHLGEYDVSSLEAPFVPEKYVEAIRAAEAAGYDTIIIDSLSHAWAGPGGILDIHDYVTATDKNSNSWTAWRHVTPRHNELVDAMLMSKCHIIATMRSKTAYIQTVENNRTVIKKVGMNPIQRDGMEYEFTIFLDLDQSHVASTSKDRTELFDGQVFKITPEVGKRLLAWLEAGAQPKPQQTPAKEEIQWDVETFPSKGDPFADNPSKQARTTPEKSPDPGLKTSGPDAWETWPFSSDENPPAQKQPKPANGKSITQAQTRKIFATAGEAGLDEIMLRQLVKEKTGKESMKDLTRSEASQIIDILLSMREPGPPAPQAQAINGNGNRRRLF